MTNKTLHRKIEQTKLTSQRVGTSIFGRVCNSCSISETHRIIVIYPAMTAFTDQYSLPNIFFDIG
jgi:hypothetical protein